MSNKSLRPRTGDFSLFGRELLPDALLICSLNPDIRNQYKAYPFRSEHNESIHHDSSLPLSA